MGWCWRWLYTGLAAVGIALAATGVLILVRPDQSITLLIYLPGIAVVESLFGLWGGVAAVLLSVGGSAATRMWFLHNPLAEPPGFYASWEEELILLLVGMFVVVLMELRRRSGERAASGAHQLAVLLENVADAVVIFTPDLRVAAMNPAARHLLNRPGGPDPIGQSAEGLQQRFHFTDLRGKVPLLSLQDAMRAGIPIREEGAIEDIADQRRIEVLISFAPWRDRRGEVAGALALITDVTALKQLQQRALDSARHLALAQMITGLTHDFNHVLDIIRRANAVLDLQENAPASERRKYRTMIEQAVEGGSGIVRRLREYLTGGTGATGPVDLRAVAREALDLTRPLWRTRPEIELVEDLNPVPPIQGNQNDFRRVLTNLIFNAVEATGTKGGRIIVHTGVSVEPGAGGDHGSLPPRRASAPEGGVTVRAWVEDDGVGIAPEIQARIFEPYVTSKSEGMGIGLFGAQKIMLAHGGKLSFTSTPGRGSRFTLEIPALGDHENAGAA